MSRTVLYGGRVFDGTGSPVAEGDVTFEDGRIVAVGTAASPAAAQTAGHGDGWLPSGLHAPLQVSYPGRPSGIVDGPEEMRKRVREIIRAVYLGGRLVRGQPGAPAPR